MNRFVPFSLLALALNCPAWGNNKSKRDEASDLLT
jgi:hypothetical protein